ncbi:autotransporter outer membrane beta-barrel domain-containing protein [Bosea sp. 2YAB26]|uniref:autotransporter family protein n=1 Tax=Bosea sp. 2YAB26 TaxID=3237478 RepID=UPI003F904B12
MLTIQTGGTVANSLGTIGNLPGGLGTVTVTGAGSSWSNAGSVVVGGQGTGTLTIQDAGAVTSGGGSVGLAVGSNGKVTVTGPNSSWTNGISGGLNIGSLGTGTLTIENGGRVINITVDNAPNIGNGPGSQGMVTVTGQGSTWINSLELNIGNFGTGALTLADGGAVTAPTVVIAARSGAVGTLNIGAGSGNPAAAPGTLNAPSLAFGAGAGTINFNHTSESYVFAPAISGNGTVNVFAGTTTLTAANTYSGPTNINAGTLRAGGPNTFSPNSPVTVASGGTLDLNGFSHTLPSVANAGLVNMGTGTAPGTLLTTPSYTGSGGTIGLNTVLGTDGSPSDRLDVGSATGNSLLSIANAGGSGELTTANGIQVVRAVNGGSTAGAFALGGIVAAGAYEYLLFQGGVTPGTENDWFLRNQLIPTPPGVTPPVGPTPPGVIPPGVTAPDTPIPLFRPEAALYTLLPGVARQLGLATLGTFHERQGDQAMLLGSGALPGAWGRVFGRRAEERRSGLLSPEMKGNIGGFQAGQDLFGWDNNGHRDRLGLFLGFASADVDARGFALAQQRALVGKLRMDATSLGAYWTHVGPSRWYVDAVLLGSWFDGDPRSTRGVGMSADGTGLTASLEAGYPIQIGAGLSLEPQAQLIWQSVSFGTERDRFSAVRFSPDDALTGRIGARLTGDWTMGGMTLKPYLLANLWRTFSGSDTATFNVTPITTGFGYSSLEFGGGVAAQVMSNVGVYAAASYTSNLGGDHRRGIKGNLGLRVTW